MASSTITATAAKAALFTGDQDIVTKPFTYLTGNTVAANTVMGMVTATKKLIPSVQTAVDGSQVPVAISVEAVDASAGDVDAPAYVGGCINPDELVWDASWTALLQKGAFLGSNITLKAARHSG